MQDGLQHTAANGKRFIGNREAVFPRTAGIDIARLHSPRDGNAIRQDAAQTAFDLRANRYAAHICNGIACCNHCADGLVRMEHARSGRIEHALPCVAPHTAGHTGIGQGRACVDTAAERMPTHCFNNTVAIHPCGKAGTERDDERRVGNPRAEIALCKHRIHEHIRPVSGNAIARGVNDDGGFAAKERIPHFNLRFAKPCGNAFHRSGSTIYGFGERHCAPHGRRVGKLGQQDGKATSVQPHRHACCNVPCAAY